MKKKRTTLLPFGSKIILLALIGLLTSAKMQGQTTLYSQSFGTSLSFPTGWSASGTSTWALINDVNSSGYTGASGGSNVKLLDAATGAKVLTYNNTTTPLSTVGYSSITVIWGARKFNNSVPSPVLQWSADGTTWNNVTFTDASGNATWALVNGATEISLPAGAAGIANLRLRWTITFGSATNNISYRFDDVTIEGIAIPTVSGFTPSTICAGGTITINGTGLTGATAANVKIGGTAVASITSASATSVVAVVGNGTTGTVSVTTAGGTATSASSCTVNAKPSVSASNGGAVCAGATLNLSSTATGVTFQWAGPVSFSSTAQNPTRTNTLTTHSGNYTVTVTSTTTGCTATASTVATVNSLPAASASNNGPVCSGNTLTLTGGPSSQTTYAWTGPNGYTSSSQSPSRTSSTTAMTGTYTLTVTSSAGCSATSSTSATVNQTPVAAIGNNSPVCSGTALNLTTSGGTSYSWSGPNSYTSTSQNPTVASAQLSHSGTYTVTVNNSGCTSTATANIVVSQVAATATSSSSSVCAGTSINLSSTPLFSRANYNSASIPDNSSTGTSSPIVISGISGNLNNTSIKIVSVKINVSHSSDDQLDISLIAPDGTALNLSSDNGGSGNNYTNTVFLNGATTTITSGSAPFTGNFAPETAFSTLNGKNANGTWNLKVADDAFFTTGTLSNWEITFADDNGFTYSWISTPSGYTDNAQNPSCTHMQTATYTVNTTGFGCSGSGTTVSVTAKPAPDVTSYSNAPICLGNGISLGADNTASGQTSGNTYAWSGPNGFSSTQQNPNIGSSTALMNGNYSVIVTNQFLCSASSITTVDVHELPALAVSSKINVTCFGLNNGTVQLNATGGTAPYDYTDFINFNNFGNFTDLAPGSYTYYVSDAYGCTGSVSFGITEPDLLQVSSTNSSPVCLGTDVNLNSNVVGGTLPYSYAWVGQNSFTSSNNSATISSVSQLHAGSYTVDITDANGCTAQQSTSIIVDLPATVSAGSDQSLCSPVAFTLNGSVGGSATSATWTTNGDGSFDDIHSLNAVYTPGANDLLNIKATLTFTTDNPNSCGAAIQQVNVKAHSSVPHIPTAVNGSTSVCPPVTGLNLSIQPSVDADSYLWEQGPTTTGITFETPVNSSSVSVAVAVSNNSTFNVRVTPSNACGTGAYKTIQLRRSVSAPLNPSGATVACPNDIKTYTVPAVTGAENFTWTAPAGSLINGNPTPYTANVRTVDVTFPAGFSAGQVGVTANVGCFSSAVKSISVSTNTVALSTISGSSTVCPGGNYTFTVPAVSGAASYQWTLPAGVSGSSSSNTINVSVTNGFVSGSIGVKAFSTCGNPSALRTKSLVRGTPSIPSSISGPSNGVCSQTAIYTCPNQAGATYNWTVPSNASINSGNGSSAIEAGFGTISTGSICVTAVNSCGSSAARCITVKGAPNSPSSVTVTPSNWCANESGIEFNANFNNVSGSYAIKWLYPGSNVATYTIGGGNSTSLVMDWKTGSGLVTAIAYNACGSGSKQISVANDNCRISNENASIENEISVSPNPATDHVSVRFYTNKNETVTLNLTDISGRVIEAQKINSIGGFNEVKFDLGKLAKGTYVMSIKTSNGIQLKKVNVE